MSSTTYSSFTKSSSTKKSFSIVQDTSEHELSTTEVDSSDTFSNTSFAANQFEGCAGTVNVPENASLEHARRLSEAGIRRLSEASVILTADTDSFTVGERVFVNGIKPGFIQYIGETKFAPGEWAGIVLEDASGKNDGSVGGVRYFQCQPKRGIFSRLTRLTRQPIDPEALNAIMASQTLSESSNDDQTHRSSSPSIRSRKSSSPSPVTFPSNELRVGDRVTVTSTQGSKMGTLRYLGITAFATGQWAGVELDDPLGKNDGSVAGKRYFHCKPMYGLFAPLSKVTRCASKTSAANSNANLNTNANSNLNNVTSPSRTARHDSVITTATITTTSRITASPVGAKIRSTGPLDSVRKEIQDLISEKDHHIEQLLKEREMDRAEVIRAAAQANAAEKKLNQLAKQLEEQQAAAEAARSGLLAQIDDLQFRVEEHSIQNSELKAKYGNLVSRNRELETQLLEERRRSEQLENEAQNSFEAEEDVLKYKQQLDILQKDLNVTRNDNKKLEELVRAKDDEILQLRQEFTKLKNESRRSSEVDDASIKIRSAQSQCALLIEQVQHLTTKCAQMDEALNHGKTEQETLYKQLESRNQEFNEEVANLQQKFENSENRYAVLLQENQALQTKLRDLQATETAGAAKLQSEYESRMRELDQEVANLLQKSENSENRYAVLLQENQSLQTKLRDLQATETAGVAKLQTEYEMRISELSQKLAVCMNDLKKQQIMNEEFRSLESEYETELQILRKKRFECENEIRNYETELCSYEDENEKLKEKLRQTELSVEDIQNRFNQDRLKWEQEKEHLKNTLGDRESRLTSLTEEVERLRVTFDAHRMELQTKLAETRHETEVAKQLQTALEKARLRVAELEELLNRTESDRDRFAEEKQDESNHLRQRCAQLEHEHQEHNKLLDKYRAELQQFRTAWSAMEKEKRHLEEKVVDLQVTLARHQASKILSQKDSQIKELLEENETSKREIDFLNSVIVDMQRKLDQLKLLMEIDRTVSIENTFADFNTNGSKSLVSPRLFCDICDIFDLHDTEDCPKQATDYSNGEINP